MKAKLDGIFWCAVAATIVLCVQAVLDHSEDVCWLAAGVGFVGVVAWLYSSEPIA